MENHRRAWSPAAGPPAARQQLPSRSGYVAGDGDDDRAHGLWAPSEGPRFREPGGPGGEPNGHTIPRSGWTALND